MNMDTGAKTFKEDLLKKMPAKVAKKRSKQIVIREEGKDQPIQANVRTIPGIITQRGCCYAGCKGVVLGPSRDILNLTHGPIGCGFYSWLTRRNQTAAGENGENFMTYCFSTDMQDENIVFGGEKKLKEAIQEAYDMFHPKAIGIFSTCPVGLIGDDVHAVAKEMTDKLGDCNIFGFSCEGYKGVSQSAGHHIANNQLFKHVIGLSDQEPETKGKYKINLLGEYNIGGDAFVIEELFEKCGIDLIATFSGNSDYDSFANAHYADLNLVMCHRSINYMAEMMETKFGIPWIKINFIGVEQTAKALRKIGEYFEDQELKDKIEEVIAEEMEKVTPVQADIKSRNEGKLAMLFVGGSRAHHYQFLFKEMGMKTAAAGYEFGHRDDYEGRQVLPNIKLDADSRNIEELKVDKDESRFKERVEESVLDKMKNTGTEVRDYAGLMPEMESNTLVIDDISHYEMEKLVEKFHPALFCAGIKEKYCVQKMGIPLKQLHSYDYGGPYAAFEGAINFYKDCDMLMNSKVWGYIKPPWKEKPELTASYASESF